MQYILTSNFRFYSAALGGLVFAAAISVIVLSAASAIEMSVAGGRAAFGLLILSLLLIALACREKKGFRIFSIAGLLFVGGTGMEVSAQQTIFNVPTADVLDKGKVYGEIDAAFKVDRTDTYGRFSSFVPRVVVGVGGKVEVGVNVTGNYQPGSDSTTIVPTVKWKFYENKKKNTALFAGTNVYVPVRNRSYNFGSYSYAAVAKTINKTRLTAGGYVASKNVFASNAVRAGGQFGIEQTLNSKVSLAADWMTGRHANGYFTPGIIYKPHPKVTTYWSYSIGNGQASSGNHYFLFELGYNFN